MATEEIPETKTDEVSKSEETTTTSEASKESEEPTASLAEMKKVFTETKVDGGKKTAWSMTLETFGMADGGKDKKCDQVTQSIDEALPLLKTMVEAAEGEKWKFALTPLEEFGATLDDYFVCFLKWSKKDDSEDYNVTKAFRRLDSYATWMQDNRKDLETPLTAAQLKEAHKAFDMKITHAEDGHIVWWVDFSHVDQVAIGPNGSIPVSDSLRYFVYASHFIMLDKQAQEKGLYFVEDCAKMGFFKMMRLFPMDVSTKLDRLTIGVLPVKMKGMYILNAAMWMNLLMGMIKPFMSRKLRQRIVNVANKSKQETLEKIVGKDSIPKDYCSLQGTIEIDELSKRFE